MKKYLFIVLLVGFSFSFGNKKSNKELADYYLGNKKHFQSLDQDIQKIIKNELDQMYQNSNNKLTELFRKELTGEYSLKTYFDRDAWLKVCSIKGYSISSSFAEDIKYDFYKQTIIDKRSLENRKIRVFEDNKSKYGISRKSLIIESMQPSWIEIVDVYGYTQLGEIGISKSDINEFKLVNAIYGVEFIGNNECLLVSKYFGDDLAFQYYEKSNADTVINKGVFEISKVNYNTIRGKNNPKITISFDNYKIVADMYKLDSKIKKSMDSTFSNYRKVIYNMMYDLIGEELELKNKKEAENKEKERKEFLERLDPLVSDARKLKALIDREIKELIDIERKRFERKKNSVWHVKESDGKKIKITLNMGKANFYLYENDQFYTQSYIRDKKKGTDYTTVRRVKPNTQYQVYLSTEDYNSLEVVKKVVTVKNKNIVLDVFRDEFKDIEIYLSDFEKKISGYQFALDIYSKNKGFEVYKLSRELDEEYYNTLIDKPFYYISLCDDITLAKYEVNSHGPFCTSGVNREWYYGNIDDFGTLFKDKYYNDPIIIDNFLRYGDGKEKLHYQPLDRIDPNDRNCARCIKLREKEIECLSNILD